MIHCSHWDRNLAMWGPVFKMRLLQKNWACITAGPILILTNESNGKRKTTNSLTITKTKSNMKKFSDAKVRGLWANPKGLTDFFVRLLRQGR